MQVQSTLEWEVVSKMIEKKRIAVLSGKGGSGKTTIATNLARVTGMPYVDLDVEEPNGFLFVKPDIKDTMDVTAFYPIVDKDKCTMCGKCADMCNFNALALGKKKVLVYDKLCHGCGVCTLVCESDAILEGQRSIGSAMRGIDERGIDAFQGVLNVGEAMAGPIISHIKNKMIGDSYVVDCAPGCSCNVVKALIDIDFAVLVGEDTQFGLHDLILAMDLCIKMGIPYGVVINKSADLSRSLVYQYCEKESIEVLGVLPFSREVAKSYSKGNLIVKDLAYKEIFEDIALKIVGER